MTENLEKLFAMRKPVNKLPVDLRRKYKIIIIKETIKDNPGIKINFLKNKLTVNEPNMNEKTAEKYLESLFVDGQIEIDKKTGVVKCVH